MTEDEELTSRRSRLAHIDRQILALEQQLQALRDERADVAAQGPTTSLSTIPTEIVLHIFALAVGFPQLGRRRGYLHTGPLLLKAAVCREWHTLVCGAPELWSKLHIVQNRMSGKSIKFFNRLRAYLPRSAPRYLELRITARTSWGGPELTEVLHAHLPRVEKLHWEGNINGHLHGLSVLRCLRISSGSWGSQTWPFRDVSHLLTHVEIHVRSADVVHVPWGQLTCLCLNISSADARLLPTALPEAVSVETLALIDEGGADELFTTMLAPGRLLLPRLRKLFIRYARRHDAHRWGSDSAPGSRALLLQRLVQQRTHDNRPEGVARLEALHVVFFSFDIARPQTQGPEVSLQALRAVLEGFTAKKLLTLQLQIKEFPAPVQYINGEDQLSGEWGAEGYIEQAGYVSFVT
uniref:F-box domain-containing protein n=1 Tax=Mycena chlorophos TaxID=658473 RepID=A0ABQ0LTR4_MYCCL|nr:predicted protein [Mycena chlorophos]